MEETHLGRRGRRCFTGRSRVARNDPVALGTSRLIQHHRPPARAQTSADIDVVEQRKRAPKPLFRLQQDHTPLAGHHPGRVHHSRASACHRRSAGHRKGDPGETDSKRGAPSAENVPGAIFTRLKDEKRYYGASIDAKRDPRRDRHAAEAAAGGETGQGFGERHGREKAETPQYRPPRRSRVKTGISHRPRSNSPCTAARMAQRLSPHPAPGRGSVTHAWAFSPAAAKRRTLRKRRTAKKPPPLQFTDLATRCHGLALFQRGHARCRRASETAH